MITTRARGLANLHVGASTLLVGIFFWVYAEFIMAYVPIVKLSPTVNLLPYFLCVIGGMVLSARDRLTKIVGDILVDMERCDRLQSGHGNALLVSGSIYSACRFFEMFQQTDLAGKCAIVTSYRPSPSDIKGEESGEGGRSGGVTGVRSSHRWVVD